jgi:hypothetical protein
MRGSFGPFMSSSESIGWTVGWRASIWGPRASIDVRCNFGGHRRGGKTQLYSIETLTENHPPDGFFP